jgi:hypothetical protein
MSEPARRRVIDWYARTLVSRLNYKENGPIEIPIGHGKRFLRRGKVLHADRESHAALDRIEAEVEGNLIRREWFSDLRSAARTRDADRSKLGRRDHNRCPQRLFRVHAGRPSRTLDGWGQFGPSQRAVKRSLPGGRCRRKDACNIRTLGARPCARCPTCVIQRRPSVDDITDAQRGAPAEQLVHN